MLQLVYISASSAPIDASMLKAILTASRRNNLAAGVTGLLVSGGRRFLQAIEGPREQVLATYARIGADPRHHALTEIHRRPVTERGCGFWAMAYGVGGNAEVGTALHQAVDLLTSGLHDPALRAIFMRFADMEREAA